MTTWSFDGQLAFNVSHWQNSTTGAGRINGLVLVDNVPAADIGIIDTIGFDSSVSR
jgi:membrane-bound lytic murein transglycosylase MltF